MKPLKTVAVIAALAAVSTGGFFVHRKYEAKQQQQRAAYAKTCDRARREAFEMPDLVAMAIRLGEPTGEARYLQNRLMAVVHDCDRRGF